MLQQTVMPAEVRAAPDEELLSVEIGPRARVAAAVVIAALVVLVGLVVLALGATLTLAMGQGDGASQLASFQEAVEQARLTAGFFCH